MKTIYLAGGCFWCTEAVFKSIHGVHEVISGYIGGTVVNPTYEQVCSGATGHAEAVKVAYDDDIVELEDLLEIFFATHDATSLNRQGADVGTQYRSAIFYTEDSQKQAIASAIGAAQSLVSGDKKIVTEVVSATAFYPAEGYHQDYYAQNTRAPYCQVIISPKLQKLQKEFPDAIESPSKN